MNQPLNPRIWRMKEFNPEQVQSLANSLGLSPWQAQVLSHRGITDAKSAREFLAPKLAMLSPPVGMQDIDTGAGLLLNALRQKQIIGIAGDYDVDGITATALLVDFLQQVGGQVLWYLPHRLEDGYGFTPNAAQLFHQNKVSLVVTVDCGISDHEGVLEAKRLGMKIIVTDHHTLPPGPLVPADAVINPHQKECAFAPHLTGVGLAFYLAAALRSKLVQAGFFKCPPPNLRQALDLVALGTCADVAPLVEENRILVNEGLKVINDTPRLGIQELNRLARGAHARNNEQLDARDLSFTLIPRLNAAGRMAHPETALKLLLSQNQEQAGALAQTLDQLNLMRRRLEDETLSQARQLWESTPEARSLNCLVLASHNWHRGVLGIVANRMTDITGKPCIMLSIENNVATGSGRSLNGIDLQQALASQAPLLERYGGHSMAVGLSLKIQNLKEFSQGINSYLAAWPGPESDLYLDAEVDLSQLNWQTLRYLEELSPFGAGNPEPVLLLRRVEMVGHSTVGQGKHLRLNLRQGGARAKGIAFSASHRPWPLRDFLYDVACIPRISNYNGRHLELVVEDWRLAQGTRI